MPEPVFEDLVKEYRELSNELDDINHAGAQGDVTNPGDQFRRRAIVENMTRLREQMALITGFDITHDQLMVDLDGHELKKPAAPAAPVSPDPTLALPAWNPKLLEAPKKREKTQTGGWLASTWAKIAAAAAALLVVAGIAVAIALTFGSGGDSDDNQQVAAESTEAPTVAPELVQTAAAAFFAPDIGSERLQELFLEAGLVSEEGDLSWYSYFEEPALTAMWEESGFAPGFTAPQIIIRSSGVAAFDLAPGADEPLWYQCGKPIGATGHEVCALPDAGPLPAGRFVVGFINLSGPYIDADPSHQYFYGFGFNTDGSAGYPGSPGFDLSARHGLTFSAFIGQSPYNPQLSDWAASVTSYANGAPSPLPADVRVIIDDDTLMFLFPGSLFPQPSFGWRAIAYGQGGASPDPATGGADVTGGDPLATLQQFDGDALLVGPTPEESPAATVGGTPTPLGGDTAVLNAQVAGGLTAFEIIYRERNVDALLAQLNPRTIEIYGEEQCRAFLSAGATDPTYNIEPLTLEGPKDWVYEVDGTSSTITKVVFVGADVTLAGETQRITMHFGIGPTGTLEWFTDCGTPLPTP